MSFTVVECAQGTPEWLASRCGRATGSRAADILATIKSGEAAARRDYRTQLVCERLTGQPGDDLFITADMRRGTLLEPMARGAYEAATGTIVRQTGFLAHDELMAGCSLDGDIGNFAGIVEFKVPKSATHLKYLLAKTLPPEYEGQCRHNLWVSGADWIDFVSYDDRFPLRLQLFRVRLFKEQAGLDGYESQVRQFLGEIDRQVIELQNLTVD